MKKVSIFVPDELHKQLKIKAIDQGTSLQAMALSALEQLSNPDTGRKPKERALSPLECRMLLAKAKSVLTAGSPATRSAVSSVIALAAQQPLGQNQE